ncbi:MAG: ATP-binding cassette domain-containing protein [Clostridiales bacterium]|nr:ATP-binding cassette domain-containing protein [Clostridiales bacterium]
MTDFIISAKHLTKDYGGGRGIFDVSLDICKGEVFGYLGTNGSGKTTTIRHMMGFLKPDGGTVCVGGLNPWKNAPDVMKKVSYIPGEIAFPDLKTGTDFFKVRAQFLGVKDFTYMNHLIDMLGLDPTASLKRMSKGMKQKTAIVAALMGERDVLIMDEPTTGLDPLMRETFLELVREEKARGRTIFMSSHIFEEIEEVCDRAAIINNGKIQSVINLSEYRRDSVRTFEVRFSDERDAQIFCTRHPGGSRAENLVRFCALANETDAAFQAMAGLQVVSLAESHPDLEDYFMKTLKGSSAGEVK